MMITTLQVIELKVRLHCKTCERSVRRALSKIKGVKCIEIDAMSSKITVMGFIERKTVVKAVWKTGRQVQVCRTSSFIGHDEESPRLDVARFRCIFPTCFSK